MPLPKRFSNLLNAGVGLMVTIGFASTTGCAETARQRQSYDFARPWASPPATVQGVSDKGQANLQIQSDPVCSGVRAALATAKETLGAVPLDQRVVVYTAGYRIVVKDVPEAIHTMEQMAETLGGYVQRIDGDQITIRVPAEHFEETASRVENLGRVAYRNLEATDTTEEYVDLQARLRSAMNVRTRLEELLARAEDVKAALAVEKELARVNQEIEQLQAKLELLKNQVTFSTITVAFERAAPKVSGPRQLGQLPFDWLRELDPDRLYRR
jgi:hypothetical protein